MTPIELRELLDYCQETGVFKWRVRPSRHVFIGDRAGNVQGTGYRRIMIGKKEYREHRLAWFYVHGVWPAQLLDHINADVADNRIANLREATPSQNCCNRRIQSRNSTGFKGVSRRKYAWEANIMLNGKPRYLGHFKTPIAAHEAYLAAADELHGEFASGG